jgi:hypothetical protein
VSQIKEDCRCPFILKAGEGELDEYANEKMIDILAIVLKEGAGNS